MYGKIDGFTVIKWIFKFLVVSIVLLVVGIFLWRFSVGRVPEELCVLSPNDALADAYSTYGENLVLYTQDQNSITRAENNYGYFTSCQVVFIPQANQVQLLVRYNDSTLKATEKDYGLAEGSLSYEKDWYDVSLVLMRDKTPDNTEDNLLGDLGEHRDVIGLERIRPDEVTAAEHHGLHSYRRLVFNNVPLDDTTLAVFADFYFAEDMGYLEEGFDIYIDEAYGTLCLYAFTEEKLSFELSKNDETAIREYIDKRN